MADPKVGTGKKPKGSGRRLYTDENPKDTVRIKMNELKDEIKSLLNNVMPERWESNHIADKTNKSKVAAIFKKGKDAIRRTRTNK